MKERLHFTITRECGSSTSVEDLGGMVHLSITDDDEMVMSIAYTYEEWGRLVLMCGWVLR